MDSSSIPLWIVFGLCVIGGAYFAAVESSFSAVNKIKVKAMAEDGNRRAKGVMYVLNHFEKALSTLLVGNNVTKIAGASVATIIATKLFTGKMATDTFEFSMLCSVASTVIIFLFSEMIPKSFANDRSNSVSLFFQRSLRLLMKVLTPISWFFTKIANFVTSLFSKGEEEPSFTEDELKEIIDTVEEEGVVDEEQSDMLKSVLDFGDTTVSDIMTMARDIEFIDIRWDVKEVLEFVRTAIHSRIPVCAGSPDKVIGTLRVRTFLTAYRQNPHVNLRTMITPPRFVRPDAKINDVLTDMRQNKQHIAMVRDADRKIVGLVTIEDILEELVGEIFDEEDVVDQNFQTLGGNRYLVNTHMIVGNLYERAGMGKAPRHMAAKPLLTLVLESNGKLPEQDEVILCGSLEITVDTVENQCPTRVVLHFLSEEELAERKAAAMAEEVEA